MPRTVIYVDSIIGEIVIVGLAQVHPPAPPDIIVTPERPRRLPAPKAPASSAPAPRTRHPRHRRQTKSRRGRLV